MIDYKRASWYGWSYLLHWEGTVIFKLAPMMILSALLGGWSASPTGIAQLDKMGSARQIFGETYGVQVFGIVFGYLCIARLNICYARYCVCPGTPKFAPRNIALFPYHMTCDGRVAVAELPVRCLGICGNVSQGRVYRR